MPKRISKQPTDVNQAAFVQVQMSTADSDLKPKAPKKRARVVTKSEISRIMSAMGKKGGKIGGKRRLATMTPEERRAVALRAAKARWHK